MACINILAVPSIQHKKGNTDCVRGYLGTNVLRQVGDFMAGELLVFVAWVDWGQETLSLSECCRWERKVSPGLRQPSLPTSSELGRVWREVFHKY